MIDYSFYRKLDGDGHMYFLHRAYLNEREDRSGLLSYTNVMAKRSMSHKIMDLRDHHVFREVLADLMLRVARTSSIVIRLEGMLSSKVHTRTSMVGCHFSVKDLHNLDFNERKNGTHFHIVTVAPFPRLQRCIIYHNAERGLEPEGNSRVGLKTCMSSRCEMFSGPEFAADLYDMHAYNEYSTYTCTC